jgi:hypothetical protein
MSTIFGYMASVKHMAGTLFKLLYGKSGDVEGASGVDYRGKKHAFISEVSE